jgi:integration host factor subunit beta
MTKSELIDRFARQAEIPRQRAAVMVDAVFSAIADALAAGNRIELRNFGNFSVRKYKGYLGRNPKSGESVMVDEKILPYFKASLALREDLNIDLAD